MRRVRLKSRKLNAQRSRPNVPVALTIGGSDSSAGAGVQADLKTFASFDVYGLTVVTCVVAETPGRVSRIQSIPTEIVDEQIKLLVANFPVRAAKTGLLRSAEIVLAVARLMRSAKFPMVVDPVMIATSGDALLEPGALAIYETELFRRATLITPNLDEASALLGSRIDNHASMEKAAQLLARKYRTSILLKGGHVRGKEAIDLLYHRGKLSRFRGRFVTGVATHGTGCTYSAAITAGLASGLSLENSIKRAKKFVTAAIARHLRWKTASGKQIHALNHWQMKPWSRGGAIAVSSTPPRQRDGYS